MSFQPTKKWKRKPTRLFSLTGTLVKEFEKSILVKKINSNAKFWIDKPEGLKIGMEGEDAIFRIEISTYTGRRDGILRTNLRLHEIEALEEEITEDHAGFMEILKGEFQEMVKTNDDHLYLIRFYSEGRNYWCRLYTDEEPKDLNTKSMISVDLRLTSMMFNSLGDQFESRRDIQYKDRDGTDVLKNVVNWFPCLSIIEMM